MIDIDHAKVFIAIGSVDMRKAIDGLSILVSQGFQLDPFAGHLFAFSNRRRTVVKILYWDRNGFALWQKRLEKERFRWPESRGEVLEIGSRQLRWLLDGLEIEQGHAHAAFRFKAVS
jgi:transposase